MGRGRVIRDYSPSQSLGKISHVSHHIHSNNRKSNNIIRF